MSSRPSHHFWEGYDNVYNALRFQTENRNQIVKIKELVLLDYSLLITSRSHRLFAKYL